MAVAVAVQAEERPGIVGPRGEKLQRSQCQDVPSVGNA